MDFEKSCGAVVFTKRDDQYLFAIVQEKSGSYSIPKGHMEGDETESETARREVFEETGLCPVFIDGFRETDEFYPREKPGVKKQVIYFLACFGDEPFVLRQSEIRRILLLTYDQAMQCFEYEGTRRVMSSAYNFLAQQLI